MCYIALVINSSHAVYKCLFVLDNLTSVLSVYKTKTLWTITNVLKYVTHLYELASTFQVHDFYHTSFTKQVKR